MVHSNVYAAIFRLFRSCHSSISPNILFSVICANSPNDFRVREFQFIPICSIFHWMQTHFEPTTKSFHFIAFFFFLEMMHISHCTHDIVYTIEILEIRCVVESERERKRVEFKMFNFSSVTNSMKLFEVYKLNLPYFVRIFHSRAENIPKRIVLLGISLV